MLRIETPEHAGSRPQAKALLSVLPSDLRGRSVLLDCGSLRVATPSFFDEIVKRVLVEAAADRLEILRPTKRARELAEKSASNRGVASRLSILEPAL